MNSFIQGIRNLIEYFPIVWRARDFDYAHTLDFLEFKLTRLRDNLRGSNESDFVGEDVISINRCISALKNIREDNFLELAETTLGIKYKETDSIVSDDRENRQLLILAIELENNAWEILGETIKDDMATWWN